MAFSSPLAFRYLQSSRENRYFSWITLLSLSGLAIGVAVLIVVVSVFDGFEYEMRQRFLQANAHIMAYSFAGSIEDPDRWAKTISEDFKEAVRGISPFVHYETMAKHGSAMQAALVRGVVPRLRAKVQGFDQLITPAAAVEQLQAEIDEAAAHRPAPALPGIIVGSGLLGTINAKVGDTIMLISPSEERAADMKRFKVIGTYQSGLPYYDKKLVLMSLTSAQNFFRMGDAVSGLEIGLFDADQSPAIRNRMSAQYALTFNEWKSFHKPLFEAMERERFVISLIVGMVVIVAGFNILTTTFVSVSQRQRDISILKALGARNGQIMRLFLIQSLCIGVGGSILGMMLAAMISFVLKNYPFIDLPDTYYLKSLPVQFSPTLYGSVSACAILVCLIAGLYPAIAASRVVPTEGIRGTGHAL